MLSSQIWWLFLESLLNCFVDGQNDDDQRRAYFDALGVLESDMILADVDASNGGKRSPQ